MHGKALFAVLGFVFGPLFFGCGGRHSPPPDQAPRPTSSSTRAATRQSTVSDSGTTEGESSARPYDATRNAAADVQEALAAANADGKRVLLDFGANWCPDCIALDRFFREPSVRD